MPQTLQWYAGIAQFGWNKATHVQLSFLKLISTGTLSSPAHTRHLVNTTASLEQLEYLAGSPSLLRLTFLFQSTARFPFEHSIAPRIKPSIQVYYHTNLPCIFPHMGAMMEAIENNWDDILHEGFQYPVDTFVRDPLQSYELDLGGGLWGSQSVATPFKTVSQLASQ